MRNTMLCMAAGGLMLTACVKTKFTNGGPTPKPSTPAQPGTGTGTTSPTEIDPEARKKICSDNFKALRIAFVVDNSGSNGLESAPGLCQPPSANLTGSDPLVCNRNSSRNIVENYTDRQNALYAIIIKMNELDKKARAKNPDFLGSEVGLSYFPDDNNGTLPAKFISGNSTALPQPMTPLKSITMTDQAFSDDLWNALRFTHAPRGLTPYGRALESAQQLLKKNRAATELRPDIIFFLTDGLPTDQNPALVKKIKSELADTTKIYFLTTYKYDKASDTQASGPKQTLQRAFANPNIKWAQSEGIYGPGDFEKYWIDLVSLPGAIADATVEIQDSKDIKPELDKILTAEQTCQ